MSFDLSRRVRSLATLGVLAVLLLVGVSWGWSAVTAPLPESEDPPICEDVTVAAGERIYPDQVTVSVLNAGNRDGLAGRTMSSLVDRGFVQGQRANAAAATDVSGPEIWTDDPRSAAVRLVASYLSKNGRGVAIRERDPVEIGINVVVGDDFKRVVKGRKSVKTASATTICSPPSA